MKAVMKTEPKPGIKIGELPVPKISPDEVLIRVEAVGICGSDEGFRACLKKEAIKVILNPT